MSRRWKPPKYSKSKSPKQQYKTINGDTGPIDQVVWMDGKNWYLIKGRFYAEIEVFPA